MGLLLPDVLRYRRLVQADGRHVVALGPEVPVAELVLEVGVLVEHHERALALEVAHEAGHAVSWEVWLTSMWTWSGIRCPSIISTPLYLAQVAEYLAHVDSLILAVYQFAPILRCEHDVVLAHPLRVRQAVRFLRHGLHTLSSRILDGLNNRQYRAGGWFCKADCHPPA